MAYLLVNAIPKHSSRIVLYPLSEKCKWSSMNADLASTTFCRITCNSPLVLILISFVITYCLIIIFITYRRQTIKIWMPFYPNLHNNNSEWTGGGGGGDETVIPPLPQFAEHFQSDRILGKLEKTLN